MLRDIRQFTQSSYLHLFVSFGVLIFAGCGAGDGKPRVAIEGRVTLNGKELPNGLVSLIPTDSAGETAVAVIENGKYVIEREAGPTPGKYKVLVESKQPTGREVRDTDNPEARVDEMQEAVPANYNVHSTLEIEIAPVPGQTFDLALKGGVRTGKGGSRK